MPYIPHTEADRAAMLGVIGAASIDELFVEVPENLRLRRALDVPSALDEPRLMSHLRALAERNVDLSRVTCFLGAGIYDRFVPATAGAVISRGEFLTAYTPYQPEVSQGYLQTIYEFQSMVAELYGAEIANASMYDGATALAEAAVMACALTKRNVVAISRGIHPHTREVISTYAWSLGFEVRELPIVEGRTRFDGLDSASACAVVQSPNFFGIVEDLAEAKKSTVEHTSLLVVGADPVSCGVLVPPGELGADIVTGEGQPLGLSMGFGGPLLGLFACRKEYARHIPGRIVGRTHDDRGRSGFTMTLRTREQDIRREKATSNICTNEALMALASTVTMAALGKTGIRQVATATVRNTQYAIAALCAAGGRLKFPGAVFTEFVLSLPRSAEDVQAALLEEGILAGLPLGAYEPSMANDLLVAVTELRTRAEIDRYATCLKAVLS